MSQAREGREVPDLIWSELERNLPNAIREASIVRNYNRITLANLTHFEFSALGVLEHDEILTIVDNADLFK